MKISVQLVIGLSCPARERFVGLTQTTAQVRGFFCI